VAKFSRSRGSCYKLSKVRALPPPDQDVKSPGIELGTSRTGGPALTNCAILASKNIVMFRYYMLFFLFLISGTDLYLTINPGSVCRFDPCKYTTCMTATPAKCLVNTKCHPVFLDAFGKTMNCKGNQMNDRLEN